MYKLIKQRNLTLIKLLFVGFFIMLTACSKDDVCGYDESFDCEGLQLDFGDACDSNGDGIYDGTVTEYCQCNSAGAGFDCEDLQLNIGNACDANGDGMLNGIVNDSCECLEETELFDCEDLQLNFGDACDSNNDGIDDGFVSDSCECVQNLVLNTCPGFIQNGDFESVTGNPNAQVDQDINLANFWKALWSSASLADLFDDNTTNYGSSCFVGPTPQSGVFAGMWIENSTNPNRDSTYREGMFNELTASINQNTGIYNLTFDYSNMSGTCASTNDVKVGVYGVYHPNSNPLPTSPTGLSMPSNIDLFGAANTVFLGEVTISASTTNIWENASFSIDTGVLTFPVNGINHIMITNSHQPFNHYGKMYLGFDNFCLTN